MAEQIVGKEFMVRARLINERWIAGMVPESNAA